MAFTDLAYNSLSNINLWLKLQEGAALTMADVPNIVPLRWAFLRDNWHALQGDILANVDSYPEPDILRETIKSFTDFIDVQRFSPNNPLQRTSSLFRFHAVFNAIQIDSISLSKQEQAEVSTKINTVNRYTKSDFLRIRSNLMEARDVQADIVGGQDDTYNTIFDRSSVASQVDIDVADVLEMVTLQGGIITCDFVLANIFRLDTVSVDPFALAKQNANNPDINIDLYKSGRLVRFNYGQDLRDIADEHLGDPDKWIDIAIANGLKPPYIDEVGIKMSLISNATGNQVNIARENVDGSLNIESLYINQAVFLKSNTQPFREQRIITNITEVPVSGEIVLELSGDLDLDKYLLADDAHIRVYIPGTINSGFFILIPSQEELSDDQRKDVPWFLRTSGEDERRAKVDLLLDSSNDLSFAPTGDLNLSFGIANAIQAVQIMMQTEQGELRRHNDFGLIVVTGLTNFDPEEIRNLLSTSINNMIEADERFDRLEKLDISYDVTKYNVSMIVRLAGSLQPIPISFTINTQ